MGFLVHSEREKTWNSCWIGCKCFHKYHMKTRIICFQVLWYFQYVFFLTKNLTFSYFVQKKLGFYAIIALDWNNEVSGVLLFIQFVDSHCFFFFVKFKLNPFFSRISQDFVPNFYFQENSFDLLYIWLLVSKFNLICGVSHSHCTTVNYFRNSLQLKCDFL